MKWKWLVGMGILWFFPLVGSAEDLGAGRISFIQGQAQIQPAGTKEWEERITKFLKEMKH